MVTPQDFCAQTQMLEQLYHHHHDHHHHHHHMIPCESTALEVSFWMVTPQDLATDSMLEPEFMRLLHSS